MKLTSLIKENIDIGDVLYSNRDQIELDFGPRTFKTLQASLMNDDEAYVRSWLIKNNYLAEKEMPFEYYYSYKEEKILIDPHTAVGIGAIKKMKLENNTVVLATAHPSKFFEIVQEQTNKKPELPEDLKNLLTKEEKYEILSKDLKNIKNYILQRV